MIENFHDFEKAVAEVMKKRGWNIIFPPANTKGYDFEAARDNICAAVQIKNWKKNVGTPQVRQLTDFLCIPRGKRFNYGILIASSGFSKPAITLSEQNDKQIFLGTFQKGRLELLNQNDEEIKIATNKDKKTYIGIFTCKGGVGKTTISAHLAGALALMGYDIALIDLDPHKHLNRLLPEGIYLPRKPPELGSTINVFNYDEYDSSFKERFVICDCSPDFKSNPPEIIKKLNYCIIPTTLNPLGISKNGLVITSTFEDIRSINKDAYLLVLINNFTPKNTKIVKALNKEYKKTFKTLETKDKKFKFIPPDECAIRYSELLFYWGSHLYFGTEGELAFQMTGGRCHPKEDFLRLVEYLEEATQIKQLK